jgi:hypothetical protein
MFASTPALALPTPHRYRALFASLLQSHSSIQQQVALSIGKEVQSLMAVPTVVAVMALAIPVSRKGTQEITH